MYEIRKRQLEKRQLESARAQLFHFHFENYFENYFQKNLELVFENHFFDDTIGALSTICRKTTSYYNVHKCILLDIYCKTITYIDIVITIHSG